MRNLILFVIIMFLAACSGEPADTSLAPGDAAAYFARIEQACSKGQWKHVGTAALWSADVFDRPQGLLLQTSGDSSGYLKAKDGVFTGTYPRELIINNTAINFGWHHLCDKSPPYT
jgi:hypothetical protein